MAIRLLINGQEADLGSNADGLLLFTYGQGDLDAPAIVQNAYSKEVMLPPTQRNAGIFGAWMQMDKVRGTADGFDALARVPFQICDNGDEVLEAGYVKLESISADGYTLHLFGGLGSFLYGLMYEDNGNKKSLASLYYGDGIDGGLSFNINATIVQAAWDRLAAYYDTIESAYDVVNFAPMHNGRPSDFDCGKGLVPVGGAHGCPGVGTGESGRGGYALVEFGRDFNEWEVRDLRSYLQRPVFNLRALFTALEDARNNGGYTFDWSGIANEWFASAWMTLPMLNVQGITQEDTPLTLFWNSASFLPPFAPQQTRIDMAEALPSGTKVSVNLGLSLQLYHDGIGGAVSKAYIGVGGLDTYIFLRLAAYDSGDNKVAESPLRCLCRANPMYSPFVAAKHLAGVVPSGEQYYSPELGYISEDAIEQQAQGELTIPANGVVDTDAISLSLVGYDISYLKFSVACVSVARGGVWSVSGARVIAYDALGEEYITNVNRIDAQEGYTSAIAESAGRVRSGAYISKADLLGGTASPAELLLSFVKTFGLVLRYDEITKTIAVLERDAFYGGGADIDLSQRIDHSQPVRVVPNGIEAKWLNFSHQQALGAFAERYAAKYGAQYGAQRVNTGSPFNADTLEVLEGVGFVAGVTGLAYSRYFYLLEDSAVGTGILPSPYLDNNCKYTLWDTATGEAKQHDVKGLDNAAQLTDINAVDEIAAPGYDGFYRLALAGADGGAAADGANILLFHDSTNRELAHLTDDTTAMLNANDGKPCWIPCLDSTPQLYVPAFVSYRFARSWGGAILDSLDMGTPREVDMPTMVYDEGKSIYARRWAAYIADRYNADAHRVTARVDWRGYQIGQDLFRNFYWFDGCWWVLEKMTDYCWNNPQPCECTFVRVLDKGAYTNGQN